MISIIVILSAIVSVLGTYIYLQNNSEELLVSVGPDDNNPELQNNDVQDKNNANDQNVAGSQKNIGGEKDEHGCYLTAGYTWCEPKNKCLRKWKENCTVEDNKNVVKNEAEEVVGKITVIIAKKHNKKEKDVMIKITQKDKSHLRGTVKFGIGGEGEEGMFLAVKNNDQWKVVYEGGGVANCSELINVYAFPKSMLGGICY
jgi:hypothetical protein